MKIAHLTFGLGMGGIETLLVNIANRQVNLGHEVHIFVINDITDESLLERLDKRVRLHLMGRAKGSRSLSPFMRLNRELSAVNPDVIHLHYAKLTPYIWLPSLRKRLCVTLHGMPNDDNSKLIRFCGPVYSISNMVRDGLKKMRGVDSVTVYNGVSLSEIKPRDNRPAGHPLRIVQVGRLEHRIKGQDLLIEAAGIMKQRGFDDFTITFIGDGASGEYLRQLAREKNVADKVEFLGTQTQEYVFEHLRDYDLFVHPSRLDGFALTVAEAMAARVPVLVSDSQGPFEVIACGRHGMAFADGDAAACADAIMRFKAAGFDPAKADEAREYACSNFDIEATSARYIMLYPVANKPC